MKRERIIKQLQEQSDKLIEDLNIQGKQHNTALENQQKDEIEKIKAETKSKLQ